MASRSESSFLWAAVRPGETFKVTEYGTMQPQMCSLASHSPPDAGWQDKVGTHASPPIPYGANKPKTMSRNRLALCLRFCRYSRCTVPHRKCMRPGGLPWSNVQLRIRSETSKSLQDICAERSSGLSGPGSGSWAPELLGSWAPGLRVRRKERSGKTSWQLLD